ncbi:helix-turn-helix domain-containing protein [Sulfitobacter sp. CW3]|uniref:helix-turn-helix domain-containing protein n=1 Tax=Sulfitobacter sp. CW3 TaxID=2861965 RepID=UPI001C5F3EB9|nr:helix-turn-helix domain-containing protein [Sulfitobacter sp. CW3]MBW4961557.1 helix-turn-helix domain-containing protein [Sulfitobacter sp. CW3]
MEYDLTPMIGNRNGSVPTSFLSEKQAADYLNMSVSWLRKCRDLGTGPLWMKFGNSVRYPKDALLEYVQQSTRNFTSEQPSPLSGQGQRND